MNAEIKTRHTPGPWAILDGAIVADDNLAPGYTVQICRPSSIVDNARHSPTEYAANALVISLAPEMAQALQEMVDATDLDTPEALEAARIKARAILSKLQ